MTQTPKPQTPDIPSDITAQEKVRRSLISSADLSIRDHTATISVDRGYSTDEKLDSSMMDALKSIRDNRGRGIGREDVDHGFIYTAYISGSRDSDDIMESLFAAMAKQSLSFEIEITDSKTGLTRTETAKEPER
jgi:hypothetical protein